MATSAANLNIEKLVDAYRKSLPDKALAVTDAWHQVEEQDFGVDSLLDLQSLMHKLAGSAGMYKFHDLSKQASFIEASLIAQQENPATTADDASSQRWRDSVRSSVQSLVDSIRSQSEKTNGAAS